MVSEHHTTGTHRQHAGAGALAPMLPIAVVNPDKENTS